MSGPTKIIKIIVISGPTACGKTDLVHSLANPESDFIINADSRQFYSYLNIGTAKPNPKQLKYFNYSLVDFLEPGEPFSAYDFLKKFQTLLEEADQHSSSKHSKIFVVGGSSFYSDVIKNGLPYFPPVNPEVKTRLAITLEEKGIDYLVNQLKEQDPDYYQIVDRKNPRRILRALEILESGGNMTELRKNRNPLPLDILEVIPILPRKIIHQRIEERIKQMVTLGWINEVEDLLKRFSAEKIRACHAIGYSEIIDYLEGKYDYNKTLSLITQKTRQLAKSQLTWIKKKLSTLFIFNPKSGYNLNKLFDESNYRFTDPIDDWMNNYPKLVTISDFFPYKRSNLSTMLITDKPQKSLVNLIGHFYE